MKWLESSLCCGVTQTHSFPPLWPGQVSIAGQAMAALQKELSSSSAGARKCIRSVKSPSPSHRVPLEAIPCPFKDSPGNYPGDIGTDFQTGLLYSGGMERIYEDWEAQVCNQG